LLGFKTREVKKYMVKKAIIVIVLVDESAGKTNEEIKKDIMQELSKEPAPIPWLKTVEKVTIIEE
jgi:hypothetical protein